MQAPLPCRGDTRVVCADIGYRHSSATLARLSSRCRTTPPKLVVITPLPLAGGAAGTLPYAYAYASVSLCRCHALSAAQAVHSCHISGREVFSSVNFTSLSFRRCWRIVGWRQPLATPTPVPSARVSVPQSASIAARRPRRYASGVRAANQHGTQPGGASRSPTFPPLILLRQALQSL